MVNADFARQFYGEASPVGRHFTPGDSGNTAFTIVGVVSSVAKRPGEHLDSPISHEPVFYLPATQISQALVNVAHIWFQPSWIVRSNGTIEGLTASMQSALAEVDPDLPFSGFFSMQDILLSLIHI